MVFTNSPLVKYTKISPNKTVNRKNKIDTITIHCVVGQCSVETLGYVFADPDREASSNYGVGYDGKIGMYVEEKDRSWCSSNAANDHRAITIEVASDTYHPYAVNDKAYNALIELVADICKRNNIKELKWKADKSLIGQPDKQNMTVHRWFDTKSCPGDYLYNRMGDIAEKVNKKLNVVVTEAKPETKPEVKPVNTTITKGACVKIASNAVYSNGVNIPNWVKNKTWVVKEVSGDRAVIDKSYDGKNAINSPINTKFLTVIASSDNSSETTPSEPAVFTPYLVKVTAKSLNIRSGAGTNYGINGVIKDKGIYTIVAEADGKGATKWLKLKSNAGWIASDYTKKL